MPKAEVLESVGDKGQPEAGRDSVPLLSLLCRGDPLGWFTSDLSSRACLGNTVFTHWEGDPWLIGELHGLGSLQSLSSQEKVCLLYSTGISSALVRQRALQCHTTFCGGRLCFGKLSLEGFCRC